MARTDPDFEVFIIGGGLNGAGVAADCAGRGLRTGLCESQDLGGTTSSNSDKFYQGGIDYLKRLDFSLVAKSFKEKDILQTRAAHLIKTLDLVVPFAPKMGSAWKLRSSLFLYGLLGGNHLKKIQRINLKAGKHPYGAPLGVPLRQARVFRDCMVDDSRLVISNFLSASALGAQLFPRTRLVSGRRHDGGWVLTLEDTITREQTIVTASCLVNSAGAWVNHVQEEILETPSRCKATLDKCSFIVTPKFYKGEQGYILQGKNHHTISVTPYMDHFCLIGATEKRMTLADIPEGVTIDETKSLLSIVNAYFSLQLTPVDIVWKYHCVLPVYEDKVLARADQAPRGSILDFNCAEGNAPLVTIVGDSLPTYRIVAEQVIKTLEPYLPDTPEARKNWTHNTPLPGGDFGSDGFDGFILRLARAYPWLPANLLQRFCSLYGTRCERLLEGTTDVGDLGEEIVPGLHEKEIKWLMQTEWAQTTEDILWRRTKLGLLTQPSDARKLTEWLDRNFRYQSPLDRYKLNHGIEMKAS